MPKPSRSKGARTRVFTGCRTCRLRHTKCDETRPGCNVCQQSNLSCGGYAPRLLWTTDNDDVVAGQEGDSSRLRYPLFSGKPPFNSPSMTPPFTTLDIEREAMSNSLQESLGSRLADDMLFELDVASKGVSVQQAFSLFKGPFGALQLCEKEEPPCSTQGPSSSLSSDRISADSEESCTEDIQCQEWAQQLSEVELDAFSTSFGFPFELILQGDTEVAPTWIPDSPTLDLFADYPTDTSPVLPSIDPNMAPNDTEENNSCLNDAIDATLEGQTVSTNALVRGPSASDLLDPALPEQAPFLLRHYKEHIEATTTAIRARRKSPWQLIFLPSAFQTFAELSLMGTASHSRVTVLCALLARSAFQIHKSDSDPKSSRYGHTIGTRHVERALCHLKKVLDLELASTWQAEYEDVLMALLAMALITPFHGGHRSQRFLFDAERLIRMRGLSHHKTQNIRILHHLYTYLRVIAESLSSSTGPLNAESEHSDPEATLCSGTFRVGEESLNQGLDPTIEKTAEIGYCDIHLQIQGLWKHTLHSAMHGIPESLMTLLAQTISFANEKAHLESRARCDLKLSNDLKCHVKTLEERIWSWCINSELTIKSSPEGAQPSHYQELIHHPCTQSMVLAIHRALVVYFYRRVYDVSAMVLQDTVKEMIEYLETCIEKLVDDDDFTPSLAWAASIAVSEATRPELRKRALSCVLITDSRGYYCGQGLSGTPIVSVG
ncbi:hypothetical protein CEP51_011731 [Fusarium floridanum]|uniref:Zn(2)-C6 fungal-type domain-containing protein n=1 Tax=Fusarium floridanum TaxID=1325733 RepID=A0A428R7Q2_9HYPO|nr:hypothetical protein CEP51_011731 [Fusarium floridanum]